MKSRRAVHWSSLPDEVALQYLTEFLHYSGPQAADVLRRARLEPHAPGLTVRLRDERHEPDKSA
ncbi:hypothetical protein [Deinococcus soli (ex Cha et al. 2016)]|uniref:Uncharacterized protein n=2 Tax=Deinococcus soli (ex Cha et al. 2016) TaxID=1309411 RepID=A0ACC6KH20_9DEIO|nr:hypothetical protein [Deinococcus soli (ex Cha et al. 2016)]MDR6218979.1 hypothetical protein [Deinococcus soli (ex Cha et al. 2016)]MDR6328776.1 hypothetical protein [Deinococcus soli (ex Cha et al. 2016)]MDR6751737.1 hypothetical protein [Deinococcus soli (ex Cha et al. 2016)]